MLGASGLGLGPYASHMKPMGSVLGGRTESPEAAKSYGFGEGLESWGEPVTKVLEMGFKRLYEESFKQIVIFEVMRILSAKSS